MDNTKLFIKAHNAIHSINNEFLDEENKKHIIYRSKNGCRATDLLVGEGSSARIITCMEQNQGKDSEYAKRARGGEAITWLISSGTWGRIENGKLINLPT